MIPILLLMVALPAVFLALLIVFKKHSSSFATASAFIGLALVLIVLGTALITGNPSINENYGYITSLGIGFNLRINAVSLVLLLMSSIVIFTAALSGNMGKEKERSASILLVLFQIGATGLFLSGNFFIFFIFWDIGVMAPFFMINILGSANRRTASYKFIIYEIFASALLLFGILLMYFYAPYHSLSLSQLPAAYSLMPVGIQESIFLLFFAAFMINMPIFPLHSWLPDAHSEASTQGSMVLSGVLTKFGGFGMLIIFTAMPIAHSFSPYIAALAAVSAFYAAFLIMRQSDIKRIVAHTTIVEMSIIMFAIATMTSLGLNGALYGMLAHGLAVAMMFLAAGAIEHIFHSRNINSLRGVSHDAKLTSYVFLIGILAMTGVPLTAGFIADVPMFLGGIATFGVYGVIPLFSLILMGAFLYFVINRSFFANKERTKPEDAIGAKQKAGYYILLAALFIFGILPFIILNVINAV